MLYLPKLAIGIGGRVYGLRYCALYLYRLDRALIEAPSAGYTGNCSLSKAFFGQQVIPSILFIFRIGIE